MRSGEWKWLFPYQKMVADDNNNNKIKIKIILMMVLEWGFYIFLNFII